MITIDFVQVRMIYILYYAHFYRYPLFQDLSVQFLIVDVYNVMKTKRYQSINHNYLYLSIGVNIAGLIIIVYLILKSRQARNVKSLHQLRSSEQVTSSIDPQTRNSKKSSVIYQRNPYQQKIPDLKCAETQTEGPIIKLNNRASHHRTLETEQRQQALQFIEASLKQQLELQQERNRFLQQKIIKMEEQLGIAYQKIHQVNQRNTLESLVIPQLPQEDGDQLMKMRNQLQFCQKRLALSYQTEKQLKSQIQIYQKIGQHSLNHPYFNRLLSMNYKYKEIIFNMQRYLLEGPSNHLNFSFTEDQHY